MVRIIKNLKLTVLGETMKKLLSILCIFSLLLTSISFSQPKSFHDVTDNFWAKQVIDDLIDKEVISGFPDGTFRPNNHITREQFAVILVRAMNLPLTPRKSSFIDVADEYWATPYIEAAKKYLTAYQTDKGQLFKPTEMTLREEIVVAMVKSSNFALTNPEILKQYKDSNSISEKLKSYIATGIQHHIISGYSKGSEKFIKPLQPVTRAEVAQMVISLGEYNNLPIGKEHKVVIDDEDDPINPNLMLTLKAKKIDEGLLLSWNALPKEGFKYYKIVAAQHIQHPSYPKNGYAEFLSDASKTNYTVKIGDDYHNGDFNQFKRNDYYYFTITAVYNDNNINSNSVASQVASEIPNTGDDKEEYGAIQVTSQMKDNELYLSWTPYTGKHFKGYKVVLSKTDADPTYPDNGYYKFITSSQRTNCTIKLGDEYHNGDFKKFEMDKYYVRIVVLRDKLPKLHSNVDVINMTK